ncbi:hypothetical protein P0Y43_25915 [Pseudomonas entomophila]|uniref:dermonecrotic toxin domain-containing protein n=1 Tax=Pseudomonas entomophila TaxID=312306 RepID=UPI0023D7F52C|nr:DUF6543 domain-containing protein [Pseudomonas entomophila]MDF0734125.1 hypothetical protein [Pseudomonas entomophila]
MTQPTPSPAAPLPTALGEFLSQTALPTDDWIGAGRGNALTQANERRRLAAKTLQALFDQAPSAPASYWDARMPGQPVSRRAYAEQQLREHFQSTLALNYGLGRLDAKGWAAGQLDSTRQYAQLQWRQPGPSIGICPGALLIQPDSDDAPWLMYRPEANNPVRAFHNEATLRQWAHEHRGRLWSNPPVPLAADSDSTFIQATALTGDGIDSLLRSLLASGAEQQTTYTPALKEALPDALAESLALLVSTDEALAAEEVHFDTLDARLPLGWCKQRIARQEQLLANYLGNDTEPTSTRMATLRAQQAKLDTQDADLQKLLAALPETPTSQTWGQPHGDQSRFEHLSQHFANNLLLEAEFQQLLGELGEPHLQWVRELVERPEPSLQRPVLPSALKLVLGDRAWMLSGFMTLQALPTNDAPTPDTTVLLYKPGQDGGLATYDSEEQLFERLLNTLYGAWPEALLESAWPQDSEALVERLERTDTRPTLVRVPISNHAFDYLTQTLLALLSQPDDASRQALRWKLGNNRNGARLQAFERLAERNRTANLPPHLHSLAHLDNAQRSALATGFDALRGAMRASSQLLARDLPERGHFARTQLHAHLRSTYALTQVPAITLDIADRTGKQRVPLPESGMGHAYKEIVTFSAERSQVPLEAFLLWALDDDLTLRLGNANIVIDDASATPTLAQRLDRSAVANLVKTLDLAGAYEQQIFSAFNGDTQQTEWQAQWRRETLKAPFEHQLRILALSRPTTLDAAGQQVLELFCQEQLDPSRPRTVQQHALDLRPGTAADGSSQRVTLSGLFLLEPANGPRLLLLPDAPNGKVVSQHDSRQAACEALEDMATDSAMRSYLASRPLDAETSAHLSYIDQALLKQFSGFIGVGIARSEPLAEIQANLLMGRLINEHRASSRSQAELYLEDQAIRHGQVYDYLKLAIGFVPGIGALVALYDGWHAANAGVEAFLRSDPGAGIEHLNSMFLSLVDALLDLGTAALPSATKAKVRTHDRQRLGGLHPTVVTRQARPHPFDGYASDAPIGPWINHPAAYGRGVYRHVESGADYILHQGVHYQVEWDATYQTWRLRGSAARSYKQPVRLSELGSWEPHGSLSGRLVDNGLAGGGAYLGRLYQQGWENLRGYLGRQPALLSPEQLVREIDLRRLAEQRKVTASQGVLMSAIDEHQSLTHPAALQAQRAYTEQLQAFVTFHEQSLERLRDTRPLAGSNQRRLRDGLAFNLVNQHPGLIRQYQFQMQGHFDHVRRLQHALETSTDPLAQLKALRSAQGDMAHSLGQLEGEFRRAATLRNKVQGANLTTYLLELDKLNMPLDPNGYRVVRLSIEAAGIIRLPAAPSDEFLFALRQVNRGLTALRSQLFSHHDLALANLSRTQEHRFLQQVKARYQRFDNHMTSWQDDFPAFVTPQSTARMRGELAKLIEEVDSALAASAPVRRAPARPRGTSRPRPFETVDQQLLIGHEVTVDGQPHMQVGNDLTQEAPTSFTRTADNKWQPTITAQPVSAAALPSLMASARKRLGDIAKQQAQLHHYKNMNMTPASLQDLADGYAITLKDLAQDIGHKAGAALTEAQRRVVRDLEQAAADLQRLGKQLRIEQIKVTTQPAFGHLDYLHNEGEVAIHWSRTLEPAKNKQGQAIEYLEEYRIDDIRTNAPLWYAHFHFKKRPGNGFARLEAGHLKLASERNQRVNAWRGALNESQANGLFGGLRPAAS